MLRLIHPLLDGMWSQMPQDFGQGDGDMLGGGGIGMRLGLWF
jgi:hypothetical protein